MLRFEHPEYLWLLLLIPLLAAGFILFNRWQKKQMRLFIGEQLFDQLAPAASMAKKIVKQILLLLIIASVLIALANPLVGTRLEEVKREGIDLFVVLDVSLSMKCEDIRPSRLEKAKGDVSDLLKKLAGDRVGMIVFAGDAFVQFPLTSDYAAADLFLSAIDVDAVPVPGTMIGSAIDLSLKSFSQDAPTQKAIIVVSDGENTEGDVLGAVEDAKKAGVRVYAVGMGTPEGGPIPSYDQNGNKTDYKHDQSGNIVLTKLDESMLQQIASSSGGTYHRGTSAGNEIDDIFKELGTLQKVQFGSKQVAGYESRYQYPLAFAILLILIDLLMSERRGKLFTRLKKFIPGFTAILLLIASPVRAQSVHALVKEGNNAYEKGKYEDAEVGYKKALEKDGKSKEAHFDLGNAYYKQKRYDESAREYGNSASAMKDARDQAQSLYNLGNTLYQQNRYQDAVGAYKKSLRLNPKDDDTRYNLLMSQAKLKEQQDQKKKDKKNDKNKDKNQDQKQNQKNQQDQQNKQDQQKQQQNQQNQAKQDQTHPQIQKKDQMPKQEADRILEAMKNNEKDIQKKLRKREAVHVKVEKDW
jgi:Ca-activated chloride channel family protein